MPSLVPTPGVPAARLPCSLLAAVLCLSLFCLSLFVAGTSTAATASESVFDPTEAGLLDATTRSHLQAGHVAEAIQTHARHVQRQGETPTAATFFAALLEVETLPRSRSSESPAPIVTLGDDEPWRAEQAAEILEANLFRLMRGDALRDLEASRLRRASTEVKGYLRDLDRSLFAAWAELRTSGGRSQPRSEAQMRAELARLVGDSFVQARSDLQRASSYFAYSLEQQPSRLALQGLSILYLDAGDLDFGLALLLYGDGLDIPMLFAADALDQYYRPSNAPEPSAGLARPDVEIPPDVLERIDPWREYARLRGAAPVDALLTVREKLQSTPDLDAEARLAHRTAGCRALRVLRNLGRDIPPWPEVMVVDADEVEAPRKLYAPPPSYTERARQARVRGQVVVEAVLDQDGCVVSGEVQQTLHPDLDAVALEAIKGWIFEPARVRDLPVSVYYNLTVNFTLR